MTDTECYRCGVEIDAGNDQWYQYQWQENPCKELVEKAIEEREFRDWFQENFVICPDCHDKIQSII